METGVIGPVEMFNDNRDFPTLLARLVGLFDAMSEPRLCGVESEEVERDREEIVRRRGAGPGLSALGVSGVVGLVESVVLEAREAAVPGASSSSFHCKCKMTDLVAHYSERQSGTRVDECRYNSQSSEYPSRRTICNVVSSGSMFTYIEELTEACCPEHGQPASISHLGQGLHRPTRST